MAGDHEVPALLRCRRWLATHWPEAGAALLVAAVSLPSWVEILGPQPREALATWGIDLVLLCWMLVVAWPRRQARLAASDRLALWLQCAAILCWLASGSLAWLPLGDGLGVGWSLAVDLLFLSFYVFLLVSIEQISTRARSEERQARRLAGWTFLARALALGLYFVAVPLLFDRSEYDSWIPSSMLYVALDLLVVFRCSTVAGAPWDARRRSSFRWLRAAAVGWAIIDVLDLLSLLPEPLPAISVPRWLDPLWALPFLPWVVALAHLRRADDTAVAPPQEWVLARRPRNLVGSTLALPVLHLALYGAGLLSPATRALRGQLVLAELAVVGTLAWRRDRLLRRPGELLKREAERSEKERALLGTAFEASPVGLALAGPTGGVVLANPALTGMLGVSSGELVDRVVDDMFAAGGAPGWSLGRRSDGSAFPARVVSRGIRDRQGHPATVSSIQDVTMRLAAEERLRLSERRIRRLVEGLPDAVLSIDEHGVRYANPAACRLLGIDDLERAWERLASVGVLGSDQSLARLLEHLPSHTLTDVRISLDGRVLDVEIVVSRREAPVVFEVVLRDATESRLLEEQGARQERLAEIGRFSGSVARQLHEARAELERGAREIERIGDAAGEDRELVADLLQAVERLDSIARGISSFSRPGDAELARVDQRELFGEVAKLLEKVIGRSSIELSVELDPSPALLLASSSQLHQAVANLLHNAAQAMPEGGAIEMRSLVGDDHVALSVRDSGPGIAAEDRERIFEPFFTTRPTGTGLGLAVVARIAERHGGRVTVAGAPGGGSIFTITLPRLEDEVEVG